MRKLLTDYERLVAFTEDRKADDAERARRQAETPQQTMERQYAEVLYARERLKELKESE